MADFRQQIPGWLDAVIRERDEMDMAYAAPHDEVCGIPVRHVTLLDICRYQQMAIRVFPTLLPVDEFILNRDYRYEAALMIAYQHRDFSPSRRRNRRIIKQVGKLLPSRLHRGLCEFNERTFGEVAGGSKPDGRTFPVYHWSALTDYVHLLGKEYGWTDEHILNMPYRRIMQLAKRIRKANDKRAIIPSRADAIVANYLKSRREGATRN